MERTTYQAKAQNAKVKEETECILLECNRHMSHCSQFGDICVHNGVNLEQEMLRSCRPLKPQPELCKRRSPRYNNLSQSKEEVGRR